MLKEIKENLQYHIDYDVDTDYSCSRYGCYDEHICRCRKIVSVGIDVKSPYTRKFLVDLAEDSRDPLDRALSFLFMNTVSEDDFESDWSGGYYGEEVDSISVYLGADEWNEMSNVEKVKLLLSDEYGDIPERYASFKDVAFEVVPIPNIIPSLSKVKNDYLVKTYASFLGRYEDEYLPAIILLKRDDSYHLVDGRHRLEASIRNKADAVGAVVIS